MSLNLKGRTVFITGASGGIGQACAEQFAPLGVRLLLLARREKLLQETARQVREAHGVAVETIVADVRDRETLRAAFNALPDSWQAVDILVNNAGLAKGQSREYEATDEEIDVMLDTNVKGLLNTTRLCVPGMITRGIGHVIHIGSVAGRQVYPGGSVYCASKHAVRALSLGLKIDLTGTPVRVSSVDPGMVETDFSRVRFDWDEDRAGQVYHGMTPLTGMDIADAVVYAATRPQHVNVSEIIILPTDQSSAQLVHRRG